jgi:hypothetical protein
MSEMTYYNTDRRFELGEYAIKTIWKSILQVTLLETT